MDLSNNHFGSIQEFDSQPSMSDDKSANHLSDGCRTILRLRAFALALRARLHSRPLME
jgi:hypothetical protein